MLGPEGRGAFAATIAYPQMLLYLGLLGAADLYAREAARQPGQDASLRRSALLFGSLTGISTMAVCIVLTVCSMPTEKRDLIPLAILLAMTLPLQHIRLAVQAIDHGAGRFNRYNVSRIIGAATPPLALGIAWLLGAQSVTTAVFVYALAMLLTAGLVQWGMTQPWRGPVDPSPRKAARLGKGYAASQVATEVLDRADLGLVLWLGTLVEQGFYASAVPIAGTLAIFPMVVATYVFQRGAAGTKILSRGKIAATLGGLTAVQICSGLILAGLLPFLVPLLLGDRFTAAIPFALWLIPAAAIRGIAIAGDGYLRGRSIARPGIFARIIALLLLIVVTASLYSSQGIFAIPIGLAVAQVAAAGIIFWAMIRNSATEPATARGASDA